MRLPDSDILLRNMVSGYSLFIIISLFIVVSTIILLINKPNEPQNFWVFLLGFFGSIIGGLVGGRIFYFISTKQNRDAKEKFVNSLKEAFWILDDQIFEGNPLNIHNFRRVKHSCMISRRALEQFDPSNITNIIDLENFELQIEEYGDTLVNFERQRSIIFDMDKEMKSIVELNKILRNKGLLIVEEEAKRIKEIIRMISMKYKINLKREIIV